jgi:hypothetical protein
MGRRAALLITGLLAGAGAVAAAAPAPDDDTDHVPPEMVAMEIGAAAGDRWPLPTDAPQSARLRAPALDGPGPLQLRWGVDLRRGASDALHPFVGLGLMTGQRTTLYVEQGVPENPAALLSQGVPAADTRLGLEFRTRSKDAAWREFGTLRMQVGLHSRLSLKPRRGGATISWHTRF